MQPTAVLGIVACLLVAAVAVVAASRRLGGGQHADSLDRETARRMVDELDALTDEQRIRVHATDARLARMEDAIEAMAIEVERVGEGQRFLSKLLADRPAQLDRVDASPRREPRTNPG